MSQPKHHSRANGHAGAGDHSHEHGAPNRNGANGRAPASTERGGTSKSRGRAASGAANGASVADAANSSAAGTAREARAGAAPPPTGRKNDETEKANGSMPKTAHTRLNDPNLAGSTDAAALQDSAAYVTAVAARVDLVGASVLLVGSQDEKIAKSELDRLREMIFGKPGAAAAASEPPEVIWDVTENN